MKAEEFEDAVREMRRRQKRYGYRMIRLGEKQELVVVKKGENTVSSPSLFTVS